MKMLMTAGLLSSARTLALAADTRADVRIGVVVGHDSRSAWQYGYARGRDEGYREGERDARQHERFSYWDERSYRDPDRGYQGWMGPRGTYVSAYRAGYQEAYTSAYRRFAAYYDGRYFRDRDHDRDDDSYDR